MRSRHEVKLALMHFEQGLTATEVARLTGIPRSTDRDWGYGRGIRQLRSGECPGHDTDCLDGAVHSDGTRIIATERKGSYVRRAPRYVFSNRSEDILGLFRAACDVAGVHCTRSSQKQVSVYSKAAVARLDEFVGPKR
jgi:hypothetical protein